MFIDERPLKFSMAIVTQVIHRALGNIFLFRVVGIMAVTALHFPFPEGMVRGEVRLDLLFPVAWVTNVNFPRFKHLPLLCSMHLMAIQTAGVMG
jgi:hypothetical protein